MLEPGLQPPTGDSQEQLSWNIQQRTENVEHVLNGPCFRTVSRSGRAFDGRPKEKRQRQRVQYTSQPEIKVVPAVSDQQQRRGHEQNRRNSLAKIATGDAPVAADSGRSQAKGQSKAIPGKVQQTSTIGPMLSVLKHTDWFSGWTELALDSRRLMLWKRLDRRFGEYE